MDKTLNSIKNLPFAEVAEQFGFFRDRARSSMSWPVYTDEQGNHVTCNLAKNTYFNRNDDSDKGSVIDFVQKRLNGNLGDVRRWYAEHYGENAPSPSPAPKYVPPTVTSIDRERIKREYEAMRPLSVGNAYLYGRGLDDATLSDPRFANAIRETSSGEPVFPARDKEGLSGYEIKLPSPQKPLFTAGAGGKSLWWSSGIAGATTLYLVEGVIDALSLAQMNRDPLAGYIATFGGSISSKQQELIKAVLDKAFEQGVKVIAAHDNDEVGLKAFDLVRGLARDGQVIERMVPINKDWNDDLMKVGQPENEPDEPEAE